MNRSPDQPPEGLDSPEAVDRRRVLEQLQASLLGRRREPVRVGRYVVGKRIGRGASGAVFIAHDGDLQRDVALKLLRVDGQVAPERLVERLMREARALARLSHPNVVHVYEAGRQGASLFIAMELVEGESLEGWQRTKRSWREIVEVYRQAGEGLAEAHRCRVVHKDFKPSNVMLRPEPRRVCVTDFGLARLMKDELAATQRDGEPPDLDGPVATATVGFTPAYAAPEQLAGRDVDERSDQYAFCVALFEALLGELPFAGDDLRTLVRNKQAGHVVPFQRGELPERIVRAIRRGLDAEPARRHASMRALLDELEPVRSRAVPAAGMVLVGLAAAATAWLGTSEPAIGPVSTPCTGFAELAERHWDPAERDRVRARFVSTGLPYAATAATTVSEDLDAYVAEWAEDATRVCLVRHANEGAAPAGRTPDSEHAACLDARLRDVRRLVERLARADAPLVERAHELVAGLPRPADCTAREPPATAIEPERLEALDEALAATHVALTLSDWPAATGHAEVALAQATALGLEQARLEAKIGLGRAQIESDRRLGRTTLEEAAWQAETLGHDRLAWLAWVGLAQLAFERASNRQQAGEWLARAESAATRLDEARRQRLAFERVNLGLVEGQDAIVRLEAVWRWLDDAGPRHDDLRIATGTSLAALLLESPDAARAVPYARAAMVLADERRGASHPSTLMARLDLGMGMIHECLLDEAEAELGAAEAGAKALGDADDRARILLALAQIHLYTGRPDEAKARLAAAEPLVSLEDSELGPHLVIFRGVVAFAEGRLEDAETHFERAARMLADAGSPAGAALARAMVGESRLYTGDVAGAAALAEAARRELQDAPPGTLGIALKVAGLAALHEGRAAEAVEKLVEARANTVACDRPELADIDHGLGVALEAVGRSEDAARHEHDAQAAFAALGPLGAARRARLEALLAGPRSAG